LLVPGDKKFSRFGEFPDLAGVGWWVVGLQAVWLTRSREAAKEGAKGRWAFFEYEYEYRPPGRTEYEYEGSFLGSSDSNFA